MTNEFDIMNTRVQFSHSWRVTYIYIRLARRFFFFFDVSFLFQDMYVMLDRAFGSSQKDNTHHNSKFTYHIAAADVKLCFQSLATQPLFHFYLSEREWEEESDVLRGVTIIFPNSFFHIKWMWREKKKYPCTFE